jgi:hypothetical protein
MLIFIQFFDIEFGESPRILPIVSSMLLHEIISTVEAVLVFTDWLARLLKQ